MITHPSLLCTRWPRTGVLGGWLPSGQGCQTEQVKTSITVNSELQTKDTWFSIQQAPCNVWDRPTLKCVFCLELQSRWVSCASPVGVQHGCPMWLGRPRKGWVGRHGTDPCTSVSPSSSLREHTSHPSQPPCFHFRNENHSLRTKVSGHRGRSWGAHGHLGGTWPTGWSSAVQGFLSIEPETLATLGSCKACGGETLPSSPAWLLWCPDVHLALQPWDPAAPGSYEPLQCPLPLGVNAFPRAPCRALSGDSRTCSHSLPCSLRVLARLPCPSLLPTPACLLMNRSNQE